MSSGSEGASDAVHRLISALDYPMFIVTAAVGDQRAGCLVGFTTQCSIDPPRFLVCLSRANRTYRVAHQTESLVVHLVPREASELADLFGGETGDEVDKFERCAWRPGPGGAPLLEECPNWFAGRILTRIPAGDHDAFLLEPYAAHGESGDRPFEFHRAKRIDSGHPA